MDLGELASLSFDDSVFVLSSGLKYTGRSYRVPQCLDTQPGFAVLPLLFIFKMKSASVLDHIRSPLCVTP